MTHRLHIVLALPGEGEMPLLAELASRDDVRLAAVIDPAGDSGAAAIAEIVGVPVCAALDAVPADAGAWLVLPSRASAAANDLAAAAEARGFSVVAADAVWNRIARTSLTVQRAPRAPANTMDVDADLAVAGAALEWAASAADVGRSLAPLLDLALRLGAVRQGSLMLLDAPAGELTIACATGLSAATRRRSRLRLGESIAGRVAVSRRAEVLTGRGDADPDEPRDRDDIATAACLPLLDADRLVGVLNLCTAAGEPRLSAEDLPALEQVAAKMAALVARALRAEAAACAATIAEAHARLDPRSPLDLGAWARVLAATLPAARVTLALVADDGDLVLASAEPDADRAPTVWRGPPTDPIWLSVLADGAPLVVREARRHEFAVLYLPLTGGAHAAGVSLELADADRLRAWRASAPYLAAMLGGALADALAIPAAARERQRLTALATAVAHLSRAALSPGALAQRVCDTALALTGATVAAAVAQCDGDLVRLAGGNAPQDGDWLAAVPPLLRAAAPDGWRATTLASDEGAAAPTPILVVTAGCGRETPALVLVGRAVTDPVGAASYGRSDAESLQPLAALLDRLPCGAPPLLNAPATAPADLGEDFLTALAREMARCDRYHTVCALLLARLAEPALAADVVPPLIARLRASDRVFVAGEHELAILVPEDAQSLDRLERRLHDELAILGARATVVRTIYPGPRMTAAEFLGRARGRV